MKRSLIIAASILCLIVASLAAIGHQLRHNITPTAAARITVGMTRADVENILGGPPGQYYRWRETELPFLFRPSGILWISDDLAVTVRFDESNRVERVFTSDDLIHGQQGFFLNGDNVIPEFARTWFGGDFAIPRHLGNRVL